MVPPSWTRPPVDQQREEIGCSDVGLAIDVPGAGVLDSVPHGIDEEVGQYRSSNTIRQSPPFPLLAVMSSQNVSMAVPLGIVAACRSYPISSMLAPPNHAHQSPSKAFPKKSVDCSTEQMGEPKFVENSSQTGLGAPSSNPPSETICARAVRLIYRWRPAMATTIVLPMHMRMFS